jgi:pimeloyl-ACP methyl ester carboxylesterase
MRNFGKLFLVIALVCRTGLSESVTPIILIPGLWYKYSKPVLGEKIFASFTEWLIEAGFPAEDIHVLNYDSTASLKTVNTQLNTQIEEILKNYPVTTQFDVFAHSLGGFVGLYAMETNGHANRFRKFVSLAGIPQGWDGYAPCRVGLCGLVHPLIIPYHSDFVLRFLSKYASEISALQKCSLYSPDDGLVRPYDAGRFDDGTNVQLEGLTHLDMVFSKTSFDAVVNSCYGGSIVSPAPTH